MSPAMDDLEVFPVMNCLMSTKVKVLDPCFCIDNNSIKTPGSNQGCNLRQSPL
jgi:hypothetical protein